MPCVCSITQANHASSKRIYSELLDSQLTAALQLHVEATSPTLCLFQPFLARREFRARARIPARSENDPKQDLRPTARLSVAALPYCSSSWPSQDCRPALWISCFPMEQLRRWRVVSANTNSTVSSHYPDDDRTCLLESNQAFLANFSAKKTRSGRVDSHVYISTYLLPIGCIGSVYSQCYRSMSMRKICICTVTSSFFPFLCLRVSLRPIRAKLLQRYHHHQFRHRPISASRHLYHAISFGE